MAQQISILIPSNAHPKASSGLGLGQNRFLLWQVTDVPQDPIGTAQKPLEMNFQSGTWGKLNKPKISQVIWVEFDAISYIRIG